MSDEQKKKILWSTFPPRCEQILSCGGTYVNTPINEIHSLKKNNEIHPF